MGKNKKKKEIVIDKETINLKEQDKVIDKVWKKYYRFEELSRDVLVSLCDNMEKEIIDFNFEMSLERKINIYLCDLVREENNDDVIIKFLDHYHHIMNMILRKLNVPFEKFDMVKEDILLQVINDYDGKEQFSIFYTKAAKEYLKKDETKEVTLETILEEIPLLGDDNTLVPTLISVGNTIGIINYIDLKDSKYVKFIALKYGFLGRYATEQEIKDYLNLTEEEYNNYLIDSYKLINVVLKEKLDKVDTDNREVIKEYKK